VYAALDYCPGGDLFTAVVERGVFHSQDDLIKTAYLQILDAVDWCHSHRIAHRDIKPENVLCSEDYSMMYLADFGLASQDAFSKDFGRGSPFYLSPGKFYPFPFAPFHSFRLRVPRRTPQVCSLLSLPCRRLGPWRRPRQHDHSSQPLAPGFHQGSALPRIPQEP
jgi:serine/threonine protein kinase